ncbi:unnamed protein product [Angiostrongylus costaricensis]|uniref:Foie-gras_1 domain-containing protein n=1 Tax=Angiostrongylus costaricensis TaxID=334426 RepID=A0A158PH36_ANGCS|nr:unnamed protein product [Angiostrongylus costaricensis]
MDPVEAGDWLNGRPQQLVFLTGLDPTNKESHSALVSTLGIAFSVRSPDRPPLNLRLVSGELGMPQKTEKTTGRGILRRDWPLKYLERVPALIVLFLDLDWDHSSWSEKKTEAESKCASLRASAATERAHELCQICHLTPRQLFVLPVLGDLTGYVSKLESALHELAQGFYQQRLKAIRARSIPNNTPALVVRQLFKLAFLSELRQDTHTAYRSFPDRNYRLAYEQCKDHMESWDGIDIFEWRTVVGLLNYKCWHFAQLFEQAVVNGLTALATLNPGTHLDLAASLYSAVNKNILALKNSNPVTKPYPVPDPLDAIHNTIFFGQRPWRIGYSGLAPANVEEDAVTAILDYVWSCVQLIPSMPSIEDGFRAVLGSVPPPLPFPRNDMTYEQISRVCLEFGDRHSKMFGQLDFNLDFPPLLPSTHLKSTFGSSALRLDFKRNEQLSTEAVAVLFVDDNDELRSELTVAGPQIADAEELAIELTTSFDLGDMFMFCGEKRVSRYFC